LRRGEVALRCGAVVDVGVMWETGEWLCCAVCLL